MVDYKGIVPWVTIAGSFDSPYYIYLKLPSNQNYDIEVYTGDILQVRKTGIGGGMIVNIGTPSDLGLPRGLNHVTVIVKQGSNIIDAKTLPVIYTETSYANISSYDENGMPLTGRWDLSDLKNNTVRIYDGSNMSIPQYSGVTDLSQMFIEFYANKNGKKYYWVSRCDKVQSGSLRLTIQPQDKVAVTVAIQLNSSNTSGWAGALDILADGLGYVSATALSLMGSGFFQLFYPSIALAIMKFYGIDYPILNATYDANSDTLYITLELDLAPMIGWIIIVGLIAGAVIVWAIKDMYLEAQKTAQIQATLDAIKNYQNLVSNLASKCYDLYPNDPQKLSQCLNSTSQLADKMSSYTNTAFAGLNEDYKELQKTIQQLTYVAIAAVVVAVIVAIAK